ncbi:MAG TPA: diacylglycerol kinase family protein [Chitinophagaceae bacterium]|nr:diacylglycerol kinase family protein [Chitinophagaceae bacterium]
MEARERFSLRKRIRSFGYALAGLRRFFLTEHNVWIHGVAAAVAILLSVLLKISPLKWVGVLFAIGLVLCAEAFNTCIEKIMDRLVPGQDETVKYVKDLAAGGVLIAAMVAAVIGCIIFLPGIIQWVSFNI